MGPSLPQKFIEDHFKDDIQKMHQYVLTYGLMGLMDLYTSWLETSDHMLRHHM